MTSRPVYNWIAILLWVACAHAQPANPEAQLRQTLRQAQAEFQQGEFSSAATLFQQAAQWAPRNGRIHMAWGLSLLKSGAAAQAHQVLLRSAQLLPGDLEVLLALIQTEVTLRNAALARRHAAEAAKAGAADIRLALLEVQIEALSGDAARIRQALRTAAQRFPGNAKLHAEIGHFLFSQRRAEIDPLALSALLRAGQTGARDAKTALALASLQSMGGATTDAIRNASWVMEQTALPIESRAAAAAIAGECYAQSGKPAEAVRHLKMAIQWMPGAEEHALALARVHRANREYALAAAALEAPRRRGAESAELLLALGTNLVSAANWAEAVPVLEQLIRRFPDREEAYGLLAQAYRGTGELARATESLRRLAERKPGFPMIHVSLAQALMEEGPTRTEAALAALAKAERSSPADPDVYFLRGKLHLAQGRLNDAVAAFSRAIALQPDSPTFRYQLGLAYQRMEKHREAKDQFERMKHLREPENR
ncbi:MAG: tetratricopeptide repeat protein [Bryobacteraceae bacterium]